MRKTRKPLAAGIALALVAALGVGATLAWLTDETEEVKNTFTVGNVDIALTETTEDYKMVPGCEIAKDPVVAVEAGSEACWLFVKVDESANFGDFMTYGVRDGWKKLESAGDEKTAVFYIEVSAADAKAGKSWYLLSAGDGALANGYVTVGSTVSKGMMDDIEGGKAAAPTLTFTAYAIQKAGFDTASEAWDEVSK